MTTASAKRILTVGAAIGGLAVIVYLALFDPTEWPAPQCMFHTLTGYDCPGCGTQRAVHALFSGDVGGAWHYNPALFFVVPLAGLYAWSPRRLHGIMYARATLFGMIAAIILWWILRNI